MKKFIVALILACSLMFGGCLQTTRTKLPEEITYYKNQSNITYRITGLLSPSDAVKFQKFTNFCIKDSRIKTVDLHFLSPGGQVYAMWTIVDAIDKLKASGIKLRTYGHGLVGSACTLIYLLGDERYIDKNAWVMIHPHSASYQEKNDDSMARMFRTWTNRYLKIVVETTLIEETECRKMLIGSSKTNTHWFSAQDCLDLKIATKII